jgi:PhnB protein
MAIPTQYQTVFPYLLLKDAVKFLEFTQTLFNAEIVSKEIRGETLVHAEFKIGNATLMLGGATDEWPPLTSSLFIYVKDADTSYAKALALGCTSIMELSDQPYGRTCGVKDVYGNIWWITSV